MKFFVHNIETKDDNGKNDMDPSVYIGEKQVRRRQFYRIQVVKAS